jgi:hypothetical protein
VERKEEGGVGTEEGGEEEVNKDRNTIFTVEEEADGNMKDESIRC